MRLKLCLYIYLNDGSCHMRSATIADRRSDRAAVHHLYLQAWGLQERHGIVDEIYWYIPRVSTPQRPERVRSATIHRVQDILLLQPTLQECWDEAEADLVLGPANYAGEWQWTPLSSLDERVGPEPFDPETLSRMARAMPLPSSAIYRHVPGVGYRMVGGDPSITEHAVYHRIIRETFETSPQYREALVRMTQRVVALNRHGHTPVAAQDADGGDMRPGPIQDLRWPSG